jgi:hypothetical protein
VGVGDVVVEGVGRHPQGLRVLRGLGPHVVAVEAVEGGVEVASVEEDGLPAVMRGGGGPGARGLDQDHPGAKSPEIRPREHLPLVPLDVDGEEVDGPGDVALAEGRQRGHRHREDPVGVAIAGVVLRLLLGERGEPPVLDRELVERQRPLLAGDPDVDADVPGSPPGDAAVGGGRRLHVEPAPAPVVEVLGQRAAHRVVGPHVDVKPVALVPEDAPQQHVLSVLGVGDHRHQERSREELDR